MSTVPSFSLRLPDDTPTLVIHGDADPLIPVAHGHATADAIPNARLHIIHGMAHTLPQAVWPEIIDTIVKHTTNGSQAPYNYINYNN